MASIEPDPESQQDEVVGETSQELDTKESDSESVGEDPPLKGGFECEFVEKPPDVLQTECPVCLQILCEPHQVTCCGKSYCKVCIEKLRGNNNACPTCKEEQIRDFPNKGLQQPLYKLKVLCTHQKEGCEWTGELRELDNHLNLDPQPEEELEECDYAIIDCRYSYIGCNTTLQRLQMKSHSKDEMPTHLSLLEKQYKMKLGELEGKLEEAELHKNALTENVSTLNKTIATQKEALAQAATDQKQLQASLTTHEKRLQASLKHFPVPPTTVIMKHFGYHQENKKEWFSPPFYTDYRGYKLCLRVDVGSYKSYRTHLSVHLCLIKGEFDDTLKWPFEQQVKVEVVSQDTTVGNKKASIYPTNLYTYDSFRRMRMVSKPPPECYQRVTTEENMSKSYIDTITSLQLINLNEVNKFVHNDCNTMEFHITSAEPYKA